jgi:hypothetical protein
VELDLVRDAIVGRLLPLMVQGGVIAHRLAEAGSLDLGTGYREAWGQGYYVRDDGTVLRGGSTSLTPISIQILATYTLEWVYERFQLPLEPYVRGAINAGVWSNSGDSGSPAGRRRTVPPTGRAAARSAGRRRLG